MKVEWKIKPYFGVFPFVLRALGWDGEEGGEGGKGYFQQAKTRKRIPQQKAVRGSGQVSVFALHPEFSSIP